MDENPYKAPAENDEHAINRRRWGAVFFAFLCLGMAVFFAIIAGILPLALYMDRETPVWSIARAAIWALANVATWSITAWATLTGRTRIRTIAIFSDLVALLSSCLLG